MLLRHRQTVIAQGEHVTLDGFADVRDGGLAALTLGNAAGQTRTFSHPESVLAGINNDLSHGRRIRARSGKLNAKDFVPAMNCEDQRHDHLRKQPPQPLGFLHPLHAETQRGHAHGDVLFLLEREGLGEGSLQNAEQLVHHLRLRPKKAL